MGQHDERRRINIQTLVVSLTPLSSQPFLFALSKFDICSGVAAFMVASFFVKLYLRVFQCDCPDQSRPHHLQAHNRYRWGIDVGF
jgi:hypothetical protein